MSCCTYISTKKRWIDSWEHIKSQKKAFLCFFSKVKVGISLRNDYICTQKYCIYKEYKCIMVKKGLLLLSLLSAIIGFSSCDSKTGNNNNTECIKFMGIPVQGEVTTFGEKLEQKGFVFAGDDTSRRFYTGTYLNKEVQIELDYDRKSEVITNAMVMFGYDMPKPDTLISEYVNKYGEFQKESKRGRDFYTWKIEGGYLCLFTDYNSMLIIACSEKKSDY